MEIRRIDPYTFENFDRYMLVLPIKDEKELNDLCKIEMNGKLYIVCKNDKTISFVENDNGELNPFEVELDSEDNIEFWQNEEFKYLFAGVGYDEFVQKENKLTSDIVSIGLIKKTDGDSYLEHRQFYEFQENNKDYFYTLVNRYKIGKHDYDLKSSLRFTEYHLPTQVELHLLKNGYFSRENIKFYFLDESGEKYFRAYIVTKDNYHLRSLLRYKGNELLDLISEAYGFKNKIDEDLKSYVYGKHEEYNKVRKLVDNYHQFLLGNKWFFNFYVYNYKNVL